MASSNVWNYQGMVVGGLPVRRKAVIRQGSVGQWRMRKERQVSRSVIGVMTENKSGIVTVTGADERATAETVYEDNWFSLLAIHHLSQSVQNTTGLRSEKEGYEGLMEAASMVAKNFGSKCQQELVIQALHKAFPSLILNMIRVILPPTRFSREYFARFTTVFFSWLIGHCQVRETEFEGRKENNVVYIPKCRFLEGTKCVGMCTNMCKIPSQKFIYESLGMPLNMVPNFEDMSCEMIFGQHPPDDDPALKQLCYKKICKAKQTHGVKCSN